ncbi:MAG TPA: sn-glycerol-3-phosphate ABC transporter ATP-binding protein UgpC [Verrucomicrobiota bacterium]|nr:sn-glycerol-3-phosphate ABC transporter ATP-binding protein UgpC [Verrucomicrobiota bacterium]
MAKVILNQLGKSFRDAQGRDVQAVRGVSLTVADGEFVVLVGPSGCGKSTTLRMIAGLESVTSGTIQIGDRIVNAVEPKDRDIAMVFQNYALYPHFTVFENMAFGLKLRKLPRSEIERRVNEAAESLGLTLYLDRLPKALSGGQRQRVAVGRAIVRQPAVFLFDEPLSNLDAQMRVQTRMELARLHDQLRATMIYVTHDQVEAMTLGDRIVVMKAGAVQQVADPLTLYHRPAHQFVAGFIGSPPMNFLKGRLRPEADGGWTFTLASSAVFHVPEAAVPASARGGGELVLGVRAEHLLADPTSQLPASVVEFVEPLGAETYVHARLAGNPLIARLDGTERPHSGTNLSLRPDWSHVHWFDATTGVALREV